MKAVDYFNKYESRMIKNDDDGLKAIGELLYEMVMEAKTLIDARNVKTTSGSVAVLKELNNKWNAICNLFEKKYGVSPIIRDGYQKYWLKEMPELMLYIKEKK